MTTPQRGPSLPPYNEELWPRQVKEAAKGHTVGEKQNQVNNLLMHPIEEHAGQSEHGLGATTLRSGVTWELGSSAAGKRKAYGGVLNSGPRPLRAMEYYW